MQTEEEAIHGTPAPTSVAPEAFAQTLLHLADQLDTATQEAPGSEAPAPEAQIDDARMEVPPEAPAAETILAPAPSGDLAETDDFEPPALDPQACLRTFPVLNPQCRHEYLEQFRALRTRLCLEQRNWSLREQDLRVVSVLSPSEGDGRSFVAANLAAALAVSDAQVLLVDTNAVAPKLHHSLGVPASPGLTEALEGPRRLANQAWWTVLHRVPDSNLFRSRPADRRRSRSPRRSPDAREYSPTPPRPRQPSTRRPARPFRAGSRNGNRPGKHA